MNDENVIYLLEAQVRNSREEDDQDEGLPKSTQDRRTAQRLCYTPYYRQVVLRLITGLQAI